MSLKMLRLLALCTAAGCLCACGRASGHVKTPELVLTYAENQADDYPTSQGAYKFKELVEEKTDGRILIQVKTGGTLGDEKSIIDQMEMGGIDFARVSLSPLAEYVPELNVLQLPYLYRDSAHMWRVLDGEIGSAFLDAFPGSGLIALSWYDAGARSFYTTEQPIARLEDMRGMKIRVQESALMSEMMRMLGAVPVPMAYDAVYSALETGQIDGAENNWPSYESTGHYRVASYFTRDEHTRVPELQLMSELTWNKLSAEDQAIIRSCAQASAEHERRLWTERAEASEQIVRESGCVLVELPDMEKARFRKHLEPLYERYCGDYMDIVEKIVAEGRVE